MEKIHHSKIMNSNGTCLSMFLLFKTGFWCFYRYETHSQIWVWFSWLESWVSSHWPRWHHQCLETEDFEKKTAAQQEEISMPIPWPSHSDRGNHALVVLGTLFPSCSLYGIIAHSPTIFSLPYLIQGKLLPLSGPSSVFHEVGPCHTLPRPSPVCFQNSPLFPSCCPAGLSHLASQSQENPGDFKFEEGLFSTMCPLLPTAVPFWICMFDAKPNLSLEVWKTMTLL